jgi:hypothetical protein
MRFKEPEGFSTTKLITFIIGMTIALMIFGSLAPTITSYLVAGNYSDNPIVAALVVLIPVVFVAVVLLTLLKGVGK